MPQTDRTPAEPNRQIVHTPRKKADVVCTVCMQSTCASTTNDLTPCPYATRLAAFAAVARDTAVNDGCPADADADAYANPAPTPPATIATREWSATPPSRRGLVFPALLRMPDRFGRGGEGADQGFVTYLERERSAHVRTSCPVSLFALAQLNPLSSRDGVRPALRGSSRCKRRGARRSLLLVRARESCRPGSTPSYSDTVLRTPRPRGGEDIKTAPGAEPRH